MNVIREIIILHQWFEDWLNGRIPNDDDLFRRFAGVMGAGMHMITPDGNLIERENLIAQVRAGHGKQEGLKIWIKNAQLRQSVDSLAIATYEEWQQTGHAAPTAHLSTAVFRANPTCPNGAEWLHVHETFFRQGA